MCVYWNPELCFCEAPCEDARLCADMTPDEWEKFIRDNDGKCMCLV